MSSVHSPLYKWVICPQPKEKVPMAVPAHVWYCQLKPVEKEIYHALYASFPCGYTEDKLLSILIHMEPNENEHYTVDYVRKSLTLTRLNSFVEKTEKGVWKLKAQQ